MPNASDLAAARAADAAGRCEALIAANPRHYEPFALLAAVTTDPVVRADLLRKALERAPAYATEVRELEARLAAATTASGR